MGEVYKARDTRLDRSVAIKILPPEFSADPDRRARFEREFKILAGLSPVPFGNLHLGHPHICSLFDVGQHDGRVYLVMEYLTGQTVQRTAAALHASATALGTRGHRPGDQEMPREGPA